MPFGGNQGSFLTSEDETRAILSAARKISEKDLTAEGVYVSQAFGVNENGPALPAALTN